jgi:hypothetical protein
MCAVRATPTLTLTLALRVRVAILDDGVGNATAEPNSRTRCEVRRAQDRGPLWDSTLVSCPQNPSGQEGRRHTLGQAVAPCACSPCTMTCEKSAVEGLREEQPGPPERLLAGELAANYARSRRPPAACRLPTADCRRLAHAHGPGWGHSCQTQTRTWATTAEQQQQPPVQVLRSSGTRTPAAGTVTATRRARTPGTPPPTSHFAPASRLPPPASGGQRRRRPGRALQCKLTRATATRGPSLARASPRWCPSLQLRPQHHTTCAPRMTHVRDAPSHQRPPPREQPDVPALPEPVHGLPLCNWECVTFIKHTPAGIISLTGALTLLPVVFFNNGRCSPPVVAPIDD